MIKIAIDKATAATHEIVAAVTNRRIRVHEFGLVAAGAVVATWKRGSTALSGPMTLATGVPLVRPIPNGLDSEPCFETDASEALNLTLGSAVQTSGWLVYDLVS